MYLSMYECSINNSYKLVFDMMTKANHIVISRLQQLEEEKEQNKLIDTAHESNIIRYIQQLDLDIRQVRISIYITVIYIY
jgi:Mg/Co/Ni transporter MgtE